MNYTLEDYYVMEDLIEKVISTDMKIKSRHGYIYEVRDILSGETNKFNSNGNTFEINLQLWELDIKEILESDSELLQKGDEIARLIIEKINNLINDLIEQSNLSANLRAFKGYVKIVYQNTVVIKENNKVYYKIGLGGIN